MKKVLPLLLLLSMNSLWAKDPARIRVGSDDKIIPHIAFGGSWTTSITLTNIWTEPAQFELRFYDDNGQPLTVPLTTGENTFAVKSTIPVGGTKFIEISGAAPNVTSGWAELAYDWSNAGIGGMAVFRQRVAGRPDFEAVVPMSYYDDYRYGLIFDNTNGFVAGLALANTGLSQEQVDLTFYDENGVQIGEPVSITLPSKGHTAFVLSQKYPQLANRRGTVDFTNESGKINALGLRFNPSGSFTSTHTLELLK